MELIESTGAIAHAADVGAHLLQRLGALSDEMPSVVSNARGRGLLAAIDLPSTETRNDVLTALRTSEHVIALACGERTLRVRPALSITSEEIDLGCDAFGRVLRHVEARA
jgi:L-lysine 6-transaminase